MLLQMLLRGANGVGYTNYPDNVVRYFVTPGGERRHRPVPRLRLPELGREHARRDGRGARDRTSSAKRRSATPATSSIPAAPSTTSTTTSALAKELEAAGAHILARQGHGRPAEAGGGARAGQGAEARRSACRSISTRTTRRASPAATRAGGGRRRRRRGRRARWTRCPA